MPTGQKKYVDEWKKLMPDYKFICWSEKDIDIDSIPFTKRAYSEGKLAFVADYTRIYALYTMGGIYIDTDVKVLRRLDDFLKYRVFTSYEFNTPRKEIKDLYKVLDNKGNRRYRSILKVPGNGLLSALIGAEKGHPMIKDCLDYYLSADFDWAYQYKLTIPTVLALQSEKYGFVYVDKRQELSEGISIFDSGIFSDYYNATRNSVAIHYCMGSWLDSSMMKIIKDKLYRNSLLRYLIHLVFPKKRFKV